MLFVLTVCAAVIARPPPSAPWNVTLKTNMVADTILTVVNRCQRNQSPPDKSRCCCLARKDSQKFFALKFVDYDRRR